MAAVTTQAVLCTPIIRVIAITKQREERRATRLQAPGYITVVAGDGRPVLCSGHRADWGGKIGNWSKMLANTDGDWELLMIETNHSLHWTGLPALPCTFTSFVGSLSKFLPALLLHIN